MTQTAFFSFFASSLSIAGLALACDGGSATAKKETPAASAKVTQTTDTTKPTAAQIRGAESEARQFLRKIADGAHDARMKPAKADSLSMAPAPMAYPPSVTTTPAAGSCCDSGGLCTSSAQTWSKAGWDALSFSIDEPHFFVYAYELAADGDSFVASATGDPDCDGTATVYEIRGSMSAGGDSKTSKVTKRE